MVGLTGCQLLPPPRALPVRTMGSHLPVTELASPEALVGRCVRYRRDGSYTLHHCPPEVRALVGRPKTEHFDSGQHQVHVEWVRPSDPPPGYGGPGGYFHARETHVHGVAYTSLSQARPKQEGLAGLDRLCQRVGPKNDIAVVERAFGGCSVYVEGSHFDPHQGPQITLDHLRREGHHLGRSRHFSLHGRADLDPAPTCDGDLTAVSVQVVPLTRLCHDVVRVRHVEALRRQRMNQRTELDALEVKLRGNEQRLAAQPRGRREQRQRTKLLAESAELAYRRDRLERDILLTEQRLDHYREDPYLVQASRGLAGIRPQDLPVPPKPANEAKPSGEIPPGEAATHDAAPSNPAAETAAVPPTEPPTRGIGDRIYDATASPDKPKPDDPSPKPDESNPSPASDEGGREATTPDEAPPLSNS